MYLNKLVTIMFVLFFTTHVYAGDYSGSATGIELDYMSGVTSNVQTQIDSKVTTTSIDSSSELETVSNLGDFFSVFSGPAIDTEADFKEAVSLEGGVDYEVFDAATAKIDESETVTQPWELQNGITVDSFLMLFDTPLTSVPTPTDGRIYCADNSTWDPINYAGTVPYLVIYDGSNYIGLWDKDGNMILSSLQLPNGTADVALSNAGEINLNEADEQLSLHSGSNGEISGEVAIPLIQHVVMTFDPDAVCDGDVDRLFVMTVGDDAPEGIIIDEWKVSFEADPTTEADLDLKRADAFIGVANAAVIDVMDTTNGTASEDTDANINAGAAVANGKVIYLEFGTAYTETGHQIIFEMWYHAEED